MSPTAKPKSEPKIPLPRLPRAPPSGRPGVTAPLPPPAGDLVGFLVDKEAKSVRLARVDAVLADPEFTAEEYRKLLKLRGGKGGKFETMPAFLKDLKSKA